METRPRAVQPVTRLLALALALVSIVPFIVATPTRSSAAASIDESAVEEAVDSDEAVRRAREESEQARRQREAAEQRLDAAAAEYEQAWSQAERLAAEADELTGAQQRREQQFAEDRSAAGDLAVAAYLSPSRQLSLSQLVLGADDARSALHLAGMIAHIGRRSDRAIAELDVNERRTRDETRQQQIVTAGAHSAAQERKIEAGRMQAALDDAATVVQTAQETVARVEREAAEQERERQREEAERRRREAEQRRREEAARLAQVRRREAAGSTGSFTPPPPVNGRVCPIGTPNGFIDSWGFPRSGGRSHKGVDIFAPRGTAQFAVADGWVDTGSNRLGGRTIWLTDTDGNRYYYAHLQSISVADGARVRAGDVIGTTGTSGNAVGTPPHLHWQYHPGGGAAVNPYPLTSALCR